MRWLTTTVAVAALISVGITGRFPAVMAQEIVLPPPRPSLTEAQTSLTSAAVAHDLDGLAAEDSISDEELNALVAPVALYPDALLAQVLVAATYPLQIVEADRLLAESERMSDDELSEAIAEQDWDPSVLVLTTGFPTVVERMADDLDWTEQLGLAMVSQDDDVLAAVQRMRREALDTGYLNSNEAQVVDQTDDQIYIRPADPDVVYVPNYDSNLAFTSTTTTSPYIAPRQIPFANPLVAGAVAFGAALLVTQLFGDDDNDNDDRGWNDYWHRERPIDWRDRQFYPRANDPWDRGNDRYAWSRERDQYWDRGRGSWRFDNAVADHRQAERREALAYIERNRQARAEHLRDLRKAAAEERAQVAANQRQLQLIRAAREQKLEAAAQARRERARIAQQDHAKAAAQKAEHDRVKAAAAQMAEQDRVKAAAAPKAQQDKAKAAAAQKARQGAAAAQKAEQEKARASAAQKQQDDKAKAAAAQKARQDKAKAATAQKARQDKARAAAAQSAQEDKAKAAAAQKQQDDKAKAAAAQKARQDKAEAATAQKARQDKARAAQKVQQQKAAQQQQAAARAQAQKQAAAKQRQQQQQAKAQVAAKQQQQRAQAQQNRKEKAANACREGQGKNCKKD